MTDLNTPPLTVLIIGSGGREHALARAIVADPAVEAVHVAPGNPGTAQIATNHPVDILSGEAVAALATEIGANLVVIGPEAPLVAGVADYVLRAGIACFGPSQAAAQLEGSKTFAKEIMAAADVPTAKSFTCETPEEVEAALDAFGPPYVVKDDGLAAGKGVVVTRDREEARNHAAASGRVVIESYLDGPEVSVFAITDGVNVRVLQPAQDYKRVGENDEGPNTGGMGAYSPLPWAPDGLGEWVVVNVVSPVLAEMRARQTPFAGLLYCGLAVTSSGPQVIEFNARFGDPETEAILPLLHSPLGVVLHAAATGRLGDLPPLEWLPHACVGVVMAANGYPAEPEKGGAINLPPDTENAHVLHAGTAIVDGQLVANGGRVLVVVGRGEHLGDARAAAYGMIEQIDFPTGFCRPDIATDAQMAAHAETLEHQKDQP